MDFKKYVEEQLTHVRVVEIKSNCKIDDEFGIIMNEDVSEDEYSMVGVNTPYFECEICGEVIEDENDIEEHWKENHLNSK